MNNVQILLNDIEEVKNNWNERSSFNLKGIGNLSVADLDVIEMYAKQYLQTGGSFNGLMPPLGNVAEVLDKYNIKDTQTYSIFG